MAATGYPAWTGTSGIGNMGASETLRNYLDLGAPNVLDSVSADEYKLLTQAVAWISRTSALLVMSVTGQESAGTEPTVEAYSATDGYGSYVGDSPTGNLPVVTETNPGEYKVQLATSYTDEASVAGGFSATATPASSVSVSRDMYTDATNNTALSYVIVNNYDWSAGGTSVSDATAMLEIA